MKTVPKQKRCDDCGIRKVSLFADLSPAELAVLCAHKTDNIYQKGQTIFYEGMRPTGLYFVHSGKVKVFKKGLWGKKQIVRLAKAGDLLTYRAVGGVSRYVVSAVALEESYICFLELEDFFSVLRQNQTLSWRVIQLLAQELDNAENVIRNFAQKTVRQRLAEALILLKHQFGGSKEDRDVLEARLTREDLANIVGTAMETVVRLLSEFKEKKLISVDGQKIRILNPSRLEKIANPDDPAPSEAYSSE